MTDLEKYALYNKKAEQIRRKIDQAKGALKQELKNLKELGCSSTKEARKKIIQLGKKKEELSEQLKEAITDLEQSYGNFLQ